MYTYRIWTVVEYIDPTGHHFHASERVRESPWWSAPATVVLMFLGSAVVLWLLPGQRTLISRFTDQFAKGNKNAGISAISSAYGAASRQGTFLNAA